MRGALVDRPGRRRPHRYKFQFVNDHADALAFRHDRDNCLAGTSTVQLKDWMTVSTAGTATGATPENVYHVGAFYQCMTAKGYRADPKGPFTAKFVAEN